MVRHTLAALMLLAAAPAVAGPLGVAGDYNAFVLGNTNMQYVDTHGKLAVGGNLQLNGVQIGSQLSQGSPTNLVVGGNLNVTSGSINGSTVVYGNVTANNPTFHGNLSAGGSVWINPNQGGSVNGSVTYGTSFTKPGWMNPPATQGSITQPVDFAAAAASLTALSQAQVGPNDPAGTFQWNQLFLTGGAGLNVFGITEAVLEGSTGGFNINAPSGATVIINVAGSDLTLLNTGLNLSGGITMDKILWNFYEATSLTFNGSWNGSVLATQAAAKAQYGAMNGNLIVAALHGYGGPSTTTSLEVHTVINGQPTFFSGTTRPVGNPDPDPNPNPVPEPGTMALFGLGAMLAAMSRRRRQTAAA
ncbi:choice-of-anchor A family protein [Sphingoaurantiacus capsulatus]|uniref:Choice-of-anchor A family protein n=1 Tax=Sphingoaurantiacus capsulatus TaxID=1771310 RepID=A0ABV7XDM0_9SPHN